jgi:hypothetical protein
MELTTMAKYDKNGAAQERNIAKIGNYGRRGFTRILNDTLNDERLGGLALGILTYALSKPCDWRVHSWQLAKRFHCGDYAIRMAMKQLRDAGYAQLRYERAKGRITGRYWQVRESPEVPWPHLNVIFNMKKTATNTNQPPHKRKSSTKERDKGRRARTRTPTSSSFCRKVPPPESEEEMYATLEAMGIRTEPDYDGQFFDQMTASGWTIRGEPVWDWPAAYQARLEVTYPGGDYHRNEVLGV